MTQRSGVPRPTPVSSPRGNPKRILPATLAASSAASANTDAVRANPLSRVAAVAVTAIAVFAAFHHTSPDFGLTRGSLASTPPPGEPLPPAPAFVSPDLHPPIPSNRWWSSL